MTAGPTPRPIPLPPEELRNVGEGDFEQIGNVLVSLLVSAGGLRPDCRVLDMGCGIGRVAIPLTRYLTPSAAYEGFDVVPSSIDWCREHITSVYPNFRFTLLDIKNSHYNPNGKTPPEAVRFPYGDAAFEFAFATSLFTHLLRPAAHRYLQEAARVLGSGGTLYATFFLLNEDVSGRIGSGETHLSFPSDLDGCLVASTEVPEAAVAYDEDALMREFAVAGFEVRRLMPGWWSGRAKKSGRFQDIVVATKT